MLFAENGAMALESWVSIITAVCTVLGILGGLHVYATRMTTKQEKISTKVDGLDKTVQTFITRSDAEQAQQRQHHHELRGTVENHTGRIGRIEGVLKVRDP